MTSFPDLFVLAPLVIIGLAILLLLGLAFWRGQLRSRGGLVCRALAEKQADFAIASRTLDIGRVVLVGVPTAGTPLANAKYMGEFIDSYTNLLSFVPDTGVTEALEGITALAKQLAVDSLAGLGGLQSMLPEGGFLRDWLNAGQVAPQRHFALASDFEPVNPGLRGGRVPHDVLRELRGAGKTPGVAVVSHRLIGPPPATVRDNVRSMKVRLTSLRRGYGGPPKLQRRRKPDPTSGG